MGRHPLTLLMMSWRDDRTGSVGSTGPGLKVRKWKERFNIDYGSG